MARGDYADERNPYERVAADMRALIMSRDWPPGHALPSTARLVEMFETTSPTVQRALIVLKDEGWIVGQRGKGRNVRPQQMRVIDAGSYFDPATTDYSYELLAVERVTPTGDVAAALSECGSHAVLRHRVMRDTQGPIEVDWSYYPADFADGTRIAEPRKIKGGVQRILAELGIPEGPGSDEVTARDATGYEAQLLELPPGVPVLRILRTTRTTAEAGGRIVEVSVLVKAGHLVAQRYPVPKA